MFNTMDLSLGLNQMICLLILVIFQGIQLKISTLSGKINAERNKFEERLGYPMSIIIRTENSNDYLQVHNVNFMAFGGREDEANLVERIRTTQNFVPQLSIVAEEHGEVVGHLLMSKAEIIEGEKRHEVIVLAPIAVRPDYQKQGVGKQLIHEGLKRCKELGYYIVLLIGHPSYYPKFGFKPARQYGLELNQFEVPNEVFMVCELRKDELKNIKGELKYPSAFFG